MAGLRTLTVIHMLRRVFVKIPSACSSTKFAELSKPEIPSIAAAKPKKIAETSPRSVGNAKLAQSVSRPLKATNKIPVTMRRAIVLRWVIKMTTATCDTSRIPTMVSIIKTARSTMVPGITGRPCQRL